MSKEHKHHETTGLSRRRFIRNSALGVAGLTLGGKLTEGISLPHIAAQSGAKSKIVLVKHSQVVDSTGKIQQPLLDKMLAKAISTFSGENSLKDAWRQYVTPEDLVGLKLNTLGLMDLQRSDYNQHFPGIISSITSGLRETGIQDKNIVVWDRSEEELQSAGFAIQKVHEREAEETIRILNELTR